MEETEIVEKLYLLPYHLTQRFLERKIGRRGIALMSAKKIFPLQVLLDSLVGLLREMKRSKIPFFYKEYGNIKKGYLVYKSTCPLEVIGEGENGERREIYFGGQYFTKSREMKIATILPSRRNGYQREFLELAESSTIIFGEPWWSIIGTLSKDENYKKEKTDKNLPKLNFELVENLYKRKLKQHGFEINFI